MLIVNLTMSGVTCETSLGHASERVIAVQLTEVRRQVLKTGGTIPGPGP